MGVRVTHSYATGVWLTQIFIASVRLTHSYAMGVRLTHTWVTTVNLTFTLRVWESQLNVVTSKKAVKHSEVMS